MTIFVSTLDVPQVEDSKGAAAMDLPAIKDNQDPPALPQDSSRGNEEQNHVLINLENHMKEDEALETQSQFFKYFVLLTLICLVGYFVFSNKKKVIEI